MLNLFFPGVYQKEKDWKYFRDILGFTPLNTQFNVYQRNRDDEGIFLLILNFYLFIHLLLIFLFFGKIAFSFLKKFHLQLEYELQVLKL